jgi:hypothetical protein
MALHKYEWYYLAAGPVATVATYGIASLVIGAPPAGENPAVMAGAYVALFWLGAPLIFVAVAPVLTSILKALTNPREARNKLRELFNRIVEFTKAVLLVASFGTACYGAFLVYSYYDVEWDCVERGNNILSISENGDIGPAEKGCTCTGMADFERRKFGRVDYAALNKDHGCNFD